ncbi:MAG: CHAT domain-containing protein [Casimicrobiaceae bacterium]
MTDEIQIRTVTVEFLRAGPPHNQLLSPLTPYLVVCGDAGAGVVHVPYEHAAFERRLKELRYETGDAGDRLAMLHDVGVEMGKILGSVPGLPGALTADPSKSATLIHVRLTLSASELALLPFELAKAPVGPEATAESWLAVQTRPPVCVTRNIRTVSMEGVHWPNKPRILFISGDPATVPFVKHREALLDAIKPFRYPGESESQDATREQFGDLLTILKNPTLADVLGECHETIYTHVHILAHGDHYESSRDSYGLVLRGPDDAPDVVSGERFASALTSVGRDSVHRPAVMTVASCDSGNIGTVTIPGASFAHSLHQSGIALVVASQFPLSMEGSVPLAGTMYHGLLWGEHPLLLLQRLRAELHARYTSTWHDWASLVVYEALPHTLGLQLDALRYEQTRRAMNAALERIDRAVQGKSNESLDVLNMAIEKAVQQLPLAGQYAVECLGLRASARKRLAQAAFTLAAQASGAKGAWDPFDLLEQAWSDYNEAVRRLLVNDGTTVQRVATLHWVLVQAVCLAAVLGKEADDDRWNAAKLCAELYCVHDSLEERAWAFASLAELYLLKLARQDLTVEEQQQVVGTAVAHADRLVSAYPFRTEFPVTSTLRQFRRYVDWWGNAAFEHVLTVRGPSSRPPWDRLIETAQVLIKKLDRKRAPPSPPSPPEDPESSSPPPATNGNGVPPGGSTPGTHAASGSAPPPAAPPRAGAGRSASTRSTSTLSSPARRTGTFFDIEMLAAGHGDALWIEYGHGDACCRWLVDCGTQQTAAQLMQRVEQVPKKERELELFVMSHIDSDHIGGALPFLRAARQGLHFGDVWFNGWRHLTGQLGARQGEMFSSAIEDLEVPWNEWRERGPIVVDGDALPLYKLPGGMQLTLLSPGTTQLRRLAPVWSRELKRSGLEPGSHVDYSRFLKGTPTSSTNIDELADTLFSGDAAPPNGSSIAFLAEFGGASVLLAADAYAPVLVSSIKRLLVERGLDRLPLAAFKVPHHGSQNNLSTDLLNLLDCRNYLFSSNGDHFCHPDRQAVARVIKHGGRQPALHFNYRSRYNEVWSRSDLQEQYAYTARYPEAESPGLRIALVGRQQ